MELFYWLLGVIPGVGVTLLVVWLLKKGIVLKWYDWLMGAIALFFAMFAAQHAYGSAVVEFEYKSAWILGLVFAGLAVVLLAITWLTVWRRHRSS